MTRCNSLLTCLSSVCVGIETTKCTFGISSPKPAAEAVTDTDAYLVMGQADVVDPAADQFRYFQQYWPACNSLEEFIERIHKKSYPLDVQRWASAYQVHIDGETDDWRSLVLRGAKRFLADLMQNQIVQGNHLHRQLLEKLQGIEEELQVFAYTQLAPVPWMPLLMPDGVLILKLNIMCTSFKYYKEEEGMKKKTKKQRELSPAEIAFHSEPCGRDAVTPVYREIVDFYGEFDSGVYHSPYTSVVGPSGIGKSYLISQIAKKRLAYVVYFNWADHVSTSYPGRSLITDTFNLAINRDELQRLFEVFFGMNLVLVKFCRELCITPAAFFDMQIKEDFERFQEEIASHLLEFHLGTTKKLAAEHVRIRSEDDREKLDYQKYVQEYLAGINGQLRTAIINVYMQLLNNKKCPEEYFAPWENLKVKPDHPEAIICLDEARGLFEITSNSLEEGEGPAWRFLAFRRALRHQSKIDPTTDSKRLFGLLLDTVSRVTDFSPPTHDDPSTREANASKLFPPIWRLDTLDTFTDNATAASTVQVRNNNKPPVTMDYRKLFSLGRPLWGALLRTGTPQEAMERVIALAQSKILRARENKPFLEGRQMELLALLSYRMNFYVSVQGLAEELASGYMRYVVAVNESRTLLRTMQPSEPLLAHIATRLMRRSGPQGRLELIKVFYNFATEGFINVGDIGEAVAALVLLFTWERAHNRLHFDQDAKPQHVFYPVPIVEFLRTLVPQNVFTEMEGFAKLDEGLARVRFFQPHGTSPGEGDRGELASSL